MTNPLFCAIDSDREEHQEADGGQGPLPDLLPQSEHPSWVTSQNRAPRERTARELEVRRVANQLRTIGDEFNATVLHRAVSRATACSVMCSLIILKGEFTPELKSHPFTTHKHDGDSSDVYIIHIIIMEFHGGQEFHPILIQWKPIVFVKYKETTYKNNILLV